MGIHEETKHTYQPDRSQHGHGLASVVCAAQHPPPGEAHLFPGGSRPGPVL